METFTKVKLGDLAEIIMGQSPESKYYNKTGDGLPFFQGVTDFGKKYPIETTWTTYSNKTADIKDILFSVRAPVGEINIAKKKSALGRGVCAIKSKNNQGEFLYFLLRANIKKIVNISNGAIYDSINKPMLEKFEFNVPNLPIQTRIASVLSTYDDLIENNEKRIKALEEMAQFLYTEWFIKPVKNGLPKGWGIKELGELVKNIHTSTKAGTHLANRQYIPIENISRKSFVLRESSNWKEAQSSLVIFEKNDILFGAMRPYFHKVAIASVPGVTRTTCFVLRAKEDIFRPLALLTMFSDAFISFASSNTKGATIPYSAWENSLENYKVSVPSEDILIKFNKKLDSIINQMVVLVSQNNNLSQTRDLLIPQLVTGKRELK